MTPAGDVLTLARALIDCESVTPAHGAVFDVLEAALRPLGFDVDRFVVGDAPDGPVENLLAVRDRGGRHFAFAGHVDVVPPGDGWTGDPFASEVRGDLLYGRGAVDMKGAVAAFVAACADLPDTGTVSLIVTGAGKHQFSPLAVNAAKAAATVVVTAWNFTASKLWTFKK